MERCRICASPIIGHTAMTKHMLEKHSSKPPDRIDFDEDESRFLEEMIDLEKAKVLNSAMDNILGGLGGSDKRREGGVDGGNSSGK